MRSPLECAVLFSGFHIWGDDHSSSLLAQRHAFRESNLKQQLVSHTSQVTLTP